MRATRLCGCSKVSEFEELFSFHVTHGPWQVWNGDHNRELQQRASAPVAGMGLVHSWMVYETGASNLFKASSGNQLHFPRSHEEGSYRTTSGYAV
eukprot:120934-Rhodomonas_salina.1